MESPELSASNKELEKDLTPSVEPAKEQVADSAENITEQVAPAAAASTVTNNETPAPEQEPEPAVTPVAEQADEPAPEQAEEPVAENHRYSGMSKAELLAALEQLIDQAVESVKADVAYIKAAFNAIRNDEHAKEREAYIADGNAAEDFLPSIDADDSHFKELLDKFKEKRAEYNAQLEAQQNENLDKKQKIIDEINQIAADTDNVGRQYGRVKQLQQDFKAIGEVPSPSVTDIWKSYQQAVERYYDMLKMNKELRDLDFKKNLEIKQQLCIEAEQLDDETDVVIAFKRLQELHVIWRETGPVAKDLREEIWARFKNSSAVINKKYQAFFEERKARDKANADAKTALCEQIEQVPTDGYKSFAAWDAATKKILELQAEWKKIGPAARKLNNVLFDRFRKVCDEFFANKAEYFKLVKEEAAANLAKKTELCEKAEALKDSTDWKKATDAFVELQKEWKKVGSVGRKQSDAIWKRFITACDAFFDNKKKQTGSQRAQEHENLKAKKGIIEQIKEVVAEAASDAPAKVREFMKQWQEIGHVPFKEKDKVYDEYKAAIDAAFDKLDMKGVRARIANFERSLSKLGGEQGKVNHERERLVRLFEQKQQEIKTYENNLGFFNAKSKTGNTLVKELERKIEKLKEESALLEQKIKLIDEKE